MFKFQQKLKTYIKYSSKKHFPEKPVEQEL